jgi:oxygen-dependent protoporphyrinogen oxidase
MSETSSIPAEGGARDRGAHDGSARVAVVGGGISGMAAAFHLTRAGCSVEVIEREGTLGGRLGAGRLGEREVMLGGKNIGRRYRSFRGFTAALGRNPYETFGINASRVVDGEVVTLDSTRRVRSARNLVRAGALRDLLRLGQLAAQVRRQEGNRYLGSPLSAALGRRYDHAPLSAHFGSEVVGHLLRPMGIRTNGAEPDELYLGGFTTNIGLLMDTYDQLRSGIQPALEAFAQRVPVRLHSHVESLTLRDGQVTGLRIATGGATASQDATVSEQSYDAVVIATPALPAAEILSTVQPALAGRLAEVSYFPGTVVLVEYDRPVFTPAVRALAMDDGPCSNAGSYGMADRHIVRYTFSGREARVAHTPNGQAQLQSDAQLEQWLLAAEERLGRHVPVAGAQRVGSVMAHWDTAYCGYVPRHGEFLGQVQSGLQELGGLALAGDYLRGSSIEACFRSGTEAAVKIMSQLRGSSTGHGRLTPSQPERALEEIVP